VPSLDREESREKREEFRAEKRRSSVNKFMNNIRAQYRKEESLAEESIAKKSPPQMAVEPSAV
jgi:hypothetical protein